MLDGIPIRVSDYLPRTVLDKDGNEVELLGVMVSEPTLEELRSTLTYRRVVLLVGRLIGEPAKAEAMTRAEEETAYCEAHRACPSCKSSRNLITTTMGPLCLPGKYRDNNRATCEACGWSGSVHDLVAGEGKGR